MGIEQTKIPNAPTSDPVRGIPTREETISLIQEQIGGAEYKQHVTARVTKVYVHEKDLPKRRRADGVITRAWNYYGRIDVVINHSGREIFNIGPMCSHFNCQPLVDEEVVLVDHDGQIFYSFPLNKMGKVNHNRARKVTGEKDVFEPTTFYARPLAIGPGDSTFQGRFGNYINLTSEPERNGKPAFPKLVIGNNMDKDLIQVEHKNYDKSFHHFHNTNTAGSCIEMTSSPLPASIQPSAIESDMTETFDSAGDCITITSDRLIMNSKLGDISLHSSDDINMTSIDSVNIVGLDRVSLGKTDSVNPILKGTESKELLLKLVSAVDQFCTTLGERPSAEEINVTHTHIQPAIDELKFQMTQIKEQFIDNGKILSKKVFSE
tara:strand:- start:81 stop:1214 length:1134 start_codon:yes stop_codon:yes gene_type:complete